MKSYTLTVDAHLGGEYIICLVCPTDNTAASVMTKDGNIMECVSGMLAKNVEWPAEVKIDTPSRQ